jgi:hypothetical protein
MSDAELPHLRLERGAFHAKPRGRAVRACDDTIRFPQRSNDGVALGITEP